VVEMLAWCGAALSCLLSVPQAIRVLRADRLDGVSASTYVIVLSNAAVWAAWSLLTGEHAVGIPALINGPAAFLILHRLATARRNTPRASDGGLLVRASSYAFGRVSAPCGVLPGPMAGEGEQHHDAQSDSRQTGRKGDGF
jgi:uncharacterized protein with PQ loop repeat